MEGTFVPGTGAGGRTQTEVTWAYNGGTVFCGHPSFHLAPGGGVEAMGFGIPADFGSIDVLTAVLIPGATVAAWDIDLESYYGSTGQGCMTHNETELVNTYALTNQQFYEIDLTPVFSAPAAGDWCSIQITNNDAGNDLYATMVRFVYTYA